MRIGFHRVMQAIHRTERFQLARLLAHGGEVIDVARRGFGTERKQACALLRTPPRIARRDRFATAVQALPARPEQGAVVGAQGTSRNQHFVQARHQFIDHALVHHES